MSETPTKLHCLHCGYDLQGTTSETCPECANPIDRAMIEAMASKPSVGTIVATILVPPGILLAAAALLFAILSFPPGSAREPALGFVTVVGFGAPLIAVVAGIALAVRTSIRLADARRVRGGESASHLSRRFFFFLCCSGLLAAQFAISISTLVVGCICAISALNH